jgi:hypothetical protein
MQPLATAVPASHRCRHLAVADITRRGRRWVGGCYPMHGQGALSKSWLWSDGRPVYQASLAGVRYQAQHTYFGYGVLQH